MAVLADSEVGRGDIRKKWSSFFAAGVMFLHERERTNAFFICDVEAVPATLIRIVMGRVYRCLIWV
jgi:hypothetical protein